MPCCGCCCRFQEPIHIPINLADQSDAIKVSCLSLLIVSCVFGFFVQATECESDLNKTV